MGIKYNGRMTLIGTAKVSKSTLNTAPDFTDAIEQKVQAIGELENSSFGQSVAMDGNTCIIGANGARAGGSSCGAAYVFVKNGNAWEEQQILVASDRQTNDNFAYSVAIDGDTCIIGGHGDDDRGTDAGSAYIFTRSGSVWTEQQKITASNAREGDIFGRNVAISGDTCIMGAYGVGSNQGAAYAFVKDNGVWVEQKIFRPNASGANDWYGRHVAISGDTVVIGSYGDDDVATGSGAIYIYDRVDGVWGEEQKIQANEIQSGAGFGSSIAIDGNTCAVGAFSFDNVGEVNSGAVYILTRTDGVWAQQQILIASDAQANDLFGDAIAIHENTCVVGARTEDDGGSSAGAVYVFTKNGNVWEEQQKLVASDAQTDDMFGTWIAVSKDICVGSPREDTGNSNVGAAYFYIGK